MENINIVNISLYHHQHCSFLSSYRYCYCC